MRLALVLLRKKMPNGHIYRGKYRIVPPVTPQHIATKRYEYELEEKNMFYLRYPYLTLEQSQGHTKILNKAENRIQKLRNEKLQDYFKTPQIRLEDRLGHLRVKDGWE